MIFTRQLATLIDSGLPLLRSLNVLSKQEREPVLKRTTETLADSVQGGNTFSDALAQHPKIFNELYVSMVKAGELGGGARGRADAIGRVPRKGAKDQGQSPFCDDLSDHSHINGGPDHGLPSRLYCAEVRGHFP